MIDARELRIGNWVKWVFPNRNNRPNKIKDCQVQSIGVLVGVLDSAYGYDQVEPIPLTEQWLIDFGFKKSMTDYSLKVNEIFTFYVVKNEMFYFCPSISIGWSVSMLYVHHLQNIYSSLTGEELTKK